MAYPVRPAAVSPLSAGLVQGPTIRGEVIGVFPTALYARLGTTILPLEGAGSIGLPTAVRVAGQLGQVAVGSPVVVGLGRLQVGERTWSVVRTWRPARVRPTGWTNAGMPDPVSYVAARVGLGPGLTPEGDDEVAGALLVAYGAGQPGWARELRRATRDRLDRTTDLSASLLGAAAEGYAVAPLVEYVEARRSGRSAAALVAAVAAIGHTSGPALLRGVEAASGSVPMEGVLSA